MEYVNLLTITIMTDETGFLIFVEIENKMWNGGKSKTNLGT